MNYSKIILFNSTSPYLCTIRLVKKVLSPIQAHTHTVKELRSLVLTSYYRKFIEDYGLIFKPLTELFLFGTLKHDQLLLI